MSTLANRGEAVGEDGGDLVGDDHVAACAALELLFQDGYDPGATTTMPWALAAEARRSS
jgi:hypothetical protein